MIRIGISPCFFHPDPQRGTFSKKTLLYFEQSMAHWVMNHGGCPILLPTPSLHLHSWDILQWVDGLILHGGADVAPENYGETPLNEKWMGDNVRDQYEMELYHQAKRRKLPILGICRGMQVINVAEGGSLFQDLNTQKPDSLIHRDQDLYDELFHEIHILSDTYLAHIYPQISLSKVNSVHHQGIKRLAEDLRIEAICPQDQTIEAVRHKDMDPIHSDTPFIMGVQWHPEYMQGRTQLLKEDQLMEGFLRAIKARGSQ